MAADKFGQKTRSFGEAATQTKLAEISDTNERIGAGFFLLAIIVAVISLGVWIFAPDTPEEIAEKQAEELAEQERRVDNTAIVRCQQTVQRASKFPSKVAFRWDAQARWHPEADRIVTGTVELMNGFGALIPHTYSCLVKGGLVTSYEVQVGG